MIKLIQPLLKDAGFMEWHKDNKDSYLAHIFIMDNADSIDVGFYNKDDTITTFEVKGKNISLKSKDEIFKKEETSLKKLNLEKVSLNFKQVDKIAEEFRQKHYKNELPNKKIFILQHLDSGQVWNVTIVTASFNTLNIKIDANTGEVLGHKLRSLMQMGEFVK